MRPQCIDDQKRIIEAVKKAGTITARKLFHPFWRRMPIEYFERHLRSISGPVGDPNKPIWMHIGPRGARVLVANPNWNSTPDSKFYVRVNGREFCDFISEDYKIVVIKFLEERTA